MTADTFTICKGNIYQSYSPALIRTLYSVTQDVDDFLYGLYNLFVLMRDVHK